MAINLGSQHFQLARLPDGQSSMNLLMEGAVLVMFKMTTCPACKSILPAFQQLAAKNSQITCAFLDVTNNQQVIRLSRQSTTSLQTVPTIIMYMYGKPYAKYASKQQNLASLEQFVTNVVADWNKAQSFVPQPTYTPQPQQPVQQQRQQQTQTQRQAPQQQPQRAHSSMQQCDPDDEDCLKMPNNVIPCNMPWESDFRKYIEYGKI